MTIFVKKYYMKKSSAIWLVLFLVTLSACNKENLFKKDKEEHKTFEQEKYDGVLASVLPKEECFIFEYPIRFIMPDESVLILDGADDSALKDWYEANIESEERPQLIYPVQIHFNEELIPVQNDDELKRIKNACREKWDYKEECFTLIFPVSFEMPDGSTITLLNEEDNGLKDWYDTNPETDQRPSVVYPVEIKFKDELLIINNDDEFERIKDACKEFQAESASKICFNFIFPISIQIGDKIIEENSVEELREALKKWFEANPDSDQKPELIYPIEIIYEDGTVKELMSEDELINAKSDC